MPSLATERGSLVVAERAADPASPDDPRDRRFREALAAAGGGTLDAAVRRDATGAARRILAHAAWLPDLAACLAIQAALPAGWIAVPRDGSAVVTGLGITLGAVESVLERRAETARLAAEADALDAQVAALRATAVRAAADAQAAADAVEAARLDQSRASGVVRAAEETERLAARQLEAVIREASWHEAQAERLRTELDRARAAVAATTAAPSTEPDVADDDPRGWRGAGGVGDPRSGAPRATGSAGRGRRRTGRGPPRCGASAGARRSVDRHGGGADRPCRARPGDPGRPRARPGHRT